MLKKTLVSIGFLAVLTRIYNSGYFIISDIVSNGPFVPEKVSSTFLYSP